ncbi:YheC/YheD family protein [Caldalkalibacillus salinus]|uniref:YheC/YheD family endospore coat-associated protein n=1 Tax=Caldalkalibacillus salinus TaxID=2803787 RepID=UPI0019245B4B|nr:YheC/YheD family protein [Caldalkalibacillus salinus]
MSEMNITITHTPNKLERFPTLQIPQTILKKLSIPSDQPISLNIAGDQQKITCCSTSSKSSQISMDQQLANALGIPDESRVKIGYTQQTQQLKIGPVLAILVSTISKNNPPYGKLNKFFQEVIVYARSRHILAYVISVEQLLKGERNVTGWTFYKNKWCEITCPYPHVVYNRIGTRRVERSNQFTDLKEKLSHRQVQLFNATFLNKWEVYEKLSDRKLQNHLPKTQVFGPLALKTFVEQYPAVFVKPVNGSLGNGIYRINRTPFGFASHYTTKNGQIFKQFNKLSQLYNYLSRRVNPKRYIVQQGIPLIQIQGRTIDFRALMQKNGSGKWSTTSMVARVGPANRFVSNIARGGEICRVTKALRYCGFKDPKTLRSKLLHVAKKSCEAIEDQYNNQFGELGVDLGVSRSGHVYLLEINSKPSKTDDTVPSSTAKGRPSVHRLLDYTQYLMNHSAK